jgi:hypothetical protein
MTLEEVLALVEPSACWKRTCEFRVRVVVFNDVLQVGLFVLLGGGILQGLGGKRLEIEVWIYSVGHKYQRDASVLSWSESDEVSCMEFSLVK